MQVGFYYERYRFFTEDQFDDPGLVRDLTTPSGFDNFTSDTSRNAVLVLWILTFPLGNRLNKITELNFYGIT